MKADTAHIEGTDVNEALSEIGSGVIGELEILQKDLNKSLENIEKIVQASETTSSNAQNSTIEVQEISSNLHELIEGVDNSSDSIAMLSHKTDEITSVVDLIKDIAEQTNLLALNATIEAARNLVGLEGAHSTEFEKDTLHPVISLLEEQREGVAALLELLDERRLSGPVRGAVGLAAHRGLDGKALRIGAIVAAQVPAHQCDHGFVESGRLHAVQDLAGLREGREYVHRDVAVQRARLDAVEDLGAHGLHRVGQDQPSQWFRHVNS